MKILVVGNGGREHCLVWKLAQSPLVEEIFVAPGNAGTAGLASNVAIDILDIEGLLNFACLEQIDLTVVGPEAALVAGIVDRFSEAGLKIFGPTKAAARLEGSKVFAKKLMKKYQIPTAEYQVFEQADEAIAYIKEHGVPIVVKAEGLAAGKGVVVASELEQAIEAVKNIMINDKFGQAGSRIVVEDYLSGEETTLLAFVDGEDILAMLPSQDHKQAYDFDQGPNTGGMGAYAPAPLITDEQLTVIEDEILRPTVAALKAEGIEYKGILYCGLMINDGQARVLEYNVRFGDPETQVILPLLQTDLIEIILAVINGHLADLTISWSAKMALTVIMASGGYPLEYQTGKPISGLSELESLSDTFVFQAGTKLADGDLLTDGGRVLAVTALAENYNEVIERAYRAVDKINFSGAHFRRDIGQKALLEKI